jgi:hypothetical protein
VCSPSAFVTVRSLTWPEEVTFSLTPVENVLLVRLAAPVLTLGKRDSADGAVGLLAELVLRTPEVEELLGMEVYLVDWLEVLLDPEEERFTALKSLLA